MNWNEYFFSLCDTVAQKSKDPSTKVGCVISDKDNRILSIGFNGFPSGVGDDAERYAVRDVKYMMVVHAEANAICAAARSGVALNGSTLYVPWMPCNECAKLIIQVDIDKVVIGEYDTSNVETRWREAWKYTELMFKEAGVEYVFTKHNG